MNILFKKTTVILLILFLAHISAYSKELKKVTLRLSWFDQFQFAGYYMAKEKGFYKDLGLDVTILPFKFGIDIPLEVSNENIDFAIGRETLLLERAKNRNIVALYALFQSTPLVLLSTKESNINTIRDFSKKNIMTTIDDASEVSLKAMIRSHKVKLDDINFLKHSHNIQDLIDKKTDVISAYISKSPYELQKKNIEYNIFDPKKFGFDMYSDFLFTSENLIKKDIKTVQLFKEASLKGWKYAYSNIKESVDIIIDKYNAQNISKEALIYEAKELSKLSYFNTLNLGEIKMDKIQRIYDLYNVMGLLPQKINIKDFVNPLNKTNNISFTQEELEYIKNKKYLKLCVLPDALPYSAIKKDKHIGFIADYSNKISKIINMPFVLVNTSSFSQSINYLEDKKCDILPSLHKTKERSEFANFTSSYFKIPYVLTTNYKISFINDLSTLSDVKIGITKGHRIISALRKKYPKITFVEILNGNNGFSLVYKEDLFGYIDSIASTWYTLQKNYSNELKISGKINLFTNLRIANIKEDKILGEILNKAVLSVSPDDVNEMLNKWTSIEYKDDINYKLLTQILFFLTLGCIFILYKQYFLNKKNKALRKELLEKSSELVKINAGLENRIKIEVRNNERKNKLLFQQTKMAAMGEMIANIAHQWRQPLNNISLLVYFVRDNYDNKNFTKDDFAVCVHDISSQLSYMSNVIEDFSAFFKPTSKETVFNLSSALKKTINLSAIEYLYKDINIIKDTKNIQLKTLENEFTQVLINILTNARDEFVRNESEEKLIFVSAIKKDTNIIIKIRDNAGGIHEDHIPRVFEHYFTTKEESKGTGIGLYMCSEIITKHMHGQILVENKEYTYRDRIFKGAEFTIILPNNLL